MKSITQKQLGQRLRQLRESNGLSQEKVAHYLGVARQAIGQIEKGDRKLGTLELTKLTDLFSVSMNDFLSTSHFSTPRQKLIGNETVPFSPEKLKNVILYILKQCGGKPNVGETVLYKLLYFVDFDAYETLGAPVSGLSYIKLQYGPVPNKNQFESVVHEMCKTEMLNIIRHNYFNKTQKRYIAQTEPDLGLFSAREVEVINKVINRLSDMGAVEIANYVHDDIPWKATPDNQIINYRLVFEREAPYAAHDYAVLYQDASALDVLNELGPMPPEEAEYYKNL